MPKKLRLDLDGLRVQSFVTSLDKRDKSKIKGGLTINSNCPDCTEVDCYTQTCFTECGTCNTCQTDCGTCESCESCIYTCFPKVYTCDPACTEGC
jgi:hypothetical protein